VSIGAGRGQSPRGRVLSYPSVRRALTRPGSAPLLGALAGQRHPVHGCLAVEDEVLVLVPHRGPHLVDGLVRSARQHLDLRRGGVAGPDRGGETPVDMQEDAARPGRSCMSTGSRSAPIRTAPRRASPDTGGSEKATSLPGHPSRAATPSLERSTTSRSTTGAVCDRGPAALRLRPAVDAPRWSALASRRAWSPRGVAVAAGRQGFAQPRPIPAWFRSGHGRSKSARVLRPVASPRAGRSGAVRAHPREPDHQSLITHLQ
jgi:hypothetical protein